MAMKQKFHIAILPSPGISHLIPFVEFAKRLLLQNNNFHVTCIIPNNGPPSKATKAIVESLPTSIDSIFLPPVSFNDFPNGIVPILQIILTMSRSLPSLRHVLESLVSKAHLSAFLTDLFGTDTLDVAKEFNIPAFIFFPSPATVLSLFLMAPKLDVTVPCEFRDLPGPMEIPGAIPIRGKDLPEPFQNRKSEIYKCFLNLAKRLTEVEGIMVNTFTDMEFGAIKAMQHQKGEPNCIISPPVYPIGPIIQTGSSSDDHGSECSTWLDNQPCGSVLYVSFGSGGTLSTEQLKELALGLEMSGQKFLWVVRRSNELPSAAYLNSQLSQGDFDPSEVLPNGFLGRTKGQGLVVASWAPQIEILRHGSTGGFLTHCGWNSTLEGVMFGKPLIAWPLFAEQEMNAVMLVEVLKVALRPKASESGLIGREEIVKVVKGLIEGEEGKRLGQRMNDLKDAANRALSKDGSSTRALSELASKWQNLEASK
ncbi:hydroquinone glucosyltransferase-like [Ziziphus jujuba]|uniref:Glycosyltransferase n=1 Tax=Ziziphus jujuba TaxID=326968 RepID=A0A6P3ZZC6_ZIZJJ|nr:hydroquinone glucosyltransferase-like [Ziziphus jujuba]